METNNNFLLTTTDIIQGKDNITYMGIVTSENVVGVNAVRDMVASLTDFWGGRSSTLEGVLNKARTECLKELEERARGFGAHAVIGVSIETQIANMITVTASGTMVKF